jgi:hypothetical protein
MAEKISKTPSKGAGGSWLYGIILMAAGAFIIVLGVMDLLNMNFITTYLIDQGYGDIAAMLPTTGVINFVIGVFAIIGGYGLIADQEWGWGISMFILVYTAAQAIIYMINTINNLGMNPSSILASAVFWISIVATVVAIVGLVYLGLTKEKYA